MISSWPEPYPDEILYSIIARCGKRQRIRHFRTLPHQLFGYRNARAMIDLPNRLTYLSKKLPGGHHCRPDRVAKELTLLPLYMPFLRLQLGQKLQIAMIDESENAERIPAIHTRRSTRQRCLRFCPTCWSEQEKSLGERYWCRTHQAFGCLVCHVHKMPLWESGVSYFFRPSLQLFVDASVIDVNRCCPIAFKPTKIAVLLAEDLHWLLNHNRFYPGAETLRSAYFDALCANGLTQLSSIKVKEFRCQIARTASAALLDCLASNLDDGPSDWLTQMLRASRIGCSSQPAVRHLLLLHALGWRPQSFFGALQERGRSKENGTGSELKDKVLTPKYQASDLIRCWWHDRGMSVNEMSRRLGSDPQKVNLIAAKLGLSFPRFGRWGNKMDTDGQGLDSIRENFRNRFVVLRSKYPKAGILELLTTDRRIVTWLRRHDWAWLEGHKPSNQHSGGAPRLDWKKRDDMVARRIPSIVAVLKSQKAKVSISAIQRVLELRIGNMRNSLPRTNRLLRKFCVAERNFREDPGQRIIGICSLVSPYLILAKLCTAYFVG
jgi:hypothetical protein